MSLFVLASAALVPVMAEVIDRVAISLGNQVITEGQIDDEVRITGFLNHEKVDLSGTARKAAAGRLIEQTLIKREMEFSRYPLPAKTEAEASFQELKSSYQSDAQYQDALRSYGINDDDVKERLWWQVTVLRFIDYRFRPGIQISDPEMRAYYDQQVPNWRREGKVPELNDVRSQIEGILTEQRIDESLDRWLAEARTQVSVRYHDEALR